MNENNNQWLKEALKKLLEDLEKKPWSSREPSSCYSADPEEIFTQRRIEREEFFKNSYRDSHCHGGEKKRRGGKTK